MKGTKDNKKKLSYVKANRQKLLLPTLKEQQRYLVYKVITDKSLGNFADVHDNIILQSNSMLGIFDGAKAGLISAKFNPQKMTGIIRIGNKYVDKLKICFGLIKNIKINNQNVDVIVDCVYVSGMINKAIDRMNA